MDDVELGELLGRMSEQQFSLFLTLVFEHRPAQSGPYPANPAADLVEGSETSPATSSQLARDFRQIDQTE